MGAVLPHIATVLVALIAAWAAISTQRQASRANQRSLIEASRSDMEKEAYERARTFDTETIIRQNRMIDELNEDVAWRIGRAFADTLRCENVVVGHDVRLSSPQLAEELHAKLALSGVPTSLETRVQVGPFKTREEAERAQRKLHELGVETVLVPPKGRR